MYFPGRLLRLGLASGSAPEYLGSMSPDEVTRKPLLKAVTPILPVRDMAASMAFYQRLGFQCEPYEDGSEYAFLFMDDLTLHLTHVISPDFGFNPSGVYLSMDDVDLYFAQITAAEVSTLTEPMDMPWRMREFAVSDPDNTLLRFGHRIHLH